MFFYRKVSAVFFVPIISLFLLSACGSSVANNSSSSGTVQIVAAENFYGDIAQQLGKGHVSVQSILSDPNVDPHAYESTIHNAIAVSAANLVIENGGGYDDWMDKLLSSSPNQKRIVIKGYEVAPTRLQDNEHVWYNIDNVQTIAQTIADKLKSLDAAHAADYDANFQAFKQSLGQVQQKIQVIHDRYNGTPVGLTETIFLYQTGPLGLKVVTPFEFQKAVAEGNDPPADSVVAAENQVRQKQIKVLIYNQQTISSVTTKVQDDAKAVQIPLIPVTETMPTGKTYQTWMLDQLNALETGLGK